MSKYLLISSRDGHSRLNCNSIFARNNSQILKYTPSPANTKKGIAKSHSPMLSVLRWWTTHSPGFSSVLLWHCVSLKSSNPYFPVALSMSIIVKRLLSSHALSSYSFSSLAVTVLYLDVVYWPHYHIISRRR